MKLFIVGYFTADEPCEIELITNNKKLAYETAELNDLLTVLEQNAKIDIGGVKYG